MAKVSVVVPVYKVEKYLDECVQSICDSTMQDIEILLIDDGSPDNCGQMCEDWATRDKRIRVFHKTNGGLSDARNYGVERANGDYIAFVDSDDKIAPDMLQKLYDACERYKTKVAICSINKWFPNGVIEKVSDLDELNPMCFLDYKELSGMYHNTAWRKLYHKSIFQNLNNRFPFGILHEDIGFWWMLMAHPFKIMYPFYIYVFTMFVVFLMSSIYHSRPLDTKIRRICRVIDHSDIYLFVAGTYTPICLLAISHPEISTGLLIVEYSLAIVGILVTVFGGLKYKVMETIAYIIYLLDGWALMFVYPFNQCLQFIVFIFILVGGIVYTAGAITYGIGKKKIWFHTIFHVFIVLAAIIQFIGIWHIVVSL